MKRLIPYLFMAVLASSCSKNDASSSSEETRVACDSYTWHGTIYTTSGDKTFDSSNASGSLHKVTLHLTINKSSTSEETQVASNSYTWHGIIYTTSGDKTFDTTNASGCSHKATLHLTINTGANTTIPAVYNKIYGATSITSDGTYLTVKTKGLPDHKSCYYPTTNALYEAKANGTLTFNGEVFARAPNTIAEKAYVFKIPLNPAVNAAHATTPMGAIGFALNGVPLYNQYAAGGVPLGNEKKGFDQYYGHPQMQGAYHYHVEPLYLTTVKFTRSSLLGFLLDGFPVYGPEENGSLVAESALDPYHGHVGATTDYPNGIYHYHITAVDPYLNGSGFYGTPGTVSQ